MSFRVLIVAGSDSSGGAGIQADIKTVTVLGGYAATAITALTAQNTTGVSSIYEVKSDFVRQQIDMVLSDIGADVIKTGMLHNGSIIKQMIDVCDSYPDIPLVVDPVMVATSGDMLVNEDCLGVFKKLISKAYLVTPNIPEAQILADMKINGVDDMYQAAIKILELGVYAVLIKGGHGSEDKIYDILMTADGIRETFISKRINTKNTHGTGCTLASAISVNLAKKDNLPLSILKAREYVYQAILKANGLGKGNGPLNHNYMIK
jgi:hydroxymethylpyrimidine/phosphomethylpyrimidine kinase